MWCIVVYTFALFTAHNKHEECGWRRFDSGMIDWLTDSLVHSKWVKQNSVWYSRLHCHNLAFLIYEDRPVVWRQIWSIVVHRSQNPARQWAILDQLTDLDWLCVSWSAMPDKAHSAALSAFAGFVHTTIFLPSYLKDVSLSAQADGISRWAVCHCSFTDRFLTRSTSSTWSLQIAKSHLYTHSL